MKLSPVLLPGDAAALLESLLPQLTAIEQEPDEVKRREAGAKVRLWLSQAIVGLRSQDPLAQPKPAQAPAETPAKKPCDCEETPPKTRARSFGEQLARGIIVALGPREG